MIYVAYLTTIVCALRTISFPFTKVCDMKSIYQIVVPPCFLYKKQLIVSIKVFYEYY